MIDIVLDMDPPRATAQAMLKNITDAIERSAATHVNEFGIYAPLIEYLDNRLDAMRTYSEPGEKSCSELAGFSLAITCAKEYALRESGGEEV